MYLLYCLFDCMKVLKREKSHSQECEQDGRERDAPCEILLSGYVLNV